MKLVYVLFNTMDLVYATQQGSQEPINSCAKTVWKLSSTIRVSSSNVNTRTKTPGAVCGSFCNLKATEFVEQLRQAPDLCIIPNYNCAWDLSFHGIDAAAIGDTSQKIENKELSTIHSSALENYLGCFCTLFMTINRRHLSFRQSSLSSSQTSSVPVSGKVPVPDINCRLDSLSARFSISDWTAVVVRNSEFDLDTADEFTDQLFCVRCEPSKPPQVFLLVKVKVAEDEYARPSVGRPTVNMPAAVRPTMHRIKQVQKVWPSMTIVAWTMSAVLLYRVRLW